MSTPWPRFTLSPITISAVASNTQSWLMKQSAPTFRRRAAPWPPMSMKLDISSVRSPMEWPTRRSKRAWVRLAEPRGQGGG